MNVSLHQKLSPLFFTEMWERTSYYGMRALLVLYLVKAMDFSDKDASQVYGLYTSFVYVTPVLGGLIADRFLGLKRSIYIGSFLMLLGHLSLAIPGLTFFYFGLVLLALGNGFFKPNMSTLVGRLYEKEPHLKDSAYTIFYMGINLGGLLGPLFCGYLGEKVNWHYGFGAAGIGMALGICIFYFGTNKFNPDIWTLPRASKVVTNEEEGSNTFRILLILLLSLFSIIFWMAFEQMGSSLNLFALRYTDRFVLGWEIPASYFQSINPLFILLLAPICITLWDRIASRSISFDPMLKFVFSLFFLGIGFAVLALVTKESQISEQNKVSFWILIFVYFWNTLSEIFLSPVGLSFVNQTAPMRFAGMLMGTWFLSNAFGHYLAGYLAGISQAQTQISDFFSIFVYSSWLGAALLLVIWFSLRKRMREIWR